MRGSVVGQYESGGRAQLADEFERSSIRVSSIRGLCHARPVG